MAGLVLLAPHRDHSKVGHVMDPVRRVACPLPPFSSIDNTLIRGRLQSENHYASTGILITRGRSTGRTAAISISNGTRIAGQCWDNAAAGSVSRLVADGPSSAPADIGDDQCHRARVVTGIRLRCYRDRE